MQDFLALEVWAVVIAGPCLLCWILGEMRGVARMKHIVEGGNSGLIERESLGSRIKPRSLSDRALAIRRARAESAMRGSRMPMPNGAPIDSAVTQVAIPDSALFAEVPTAEQSREEADWRRREVEALWAESEGALNPEAVPEAVKVTRKYRDSVAALAQSNAQVSADTYTDHALAAFALPVSQPTLQERFCRDAYEDAFTIELPETEAIPNRRKRQAMRSDVTRPLRMSQCR